MKKLFAVLAVLTGLAPALFAGAKEDVPVNKTAQGIDFNQSMDVSGYSRFSAQAVYSDGTPAAHTLDVGRKSTATIVVTDAAALASKRASVTITITSNSTTALTGAFVTLNGQRFTQGTDWSIGASSAITGSNISAAIDRSPTFISTNSFGVIIASATDVGTYANGWAVTASTPTAISTGTGNFAGGQDNAYLNIAGVTLTQGTNWTAGTSTQTAAKAISDAIMANSTLTSIIVSTWATGTVISTSVVEGSVNYGISVSTPALRINQNGFVGGTTSAVSISADQITKTSHGLTTGLQVLYTTGTGMSISGLSNATTYYAIRVDDNTYKLATTSTTAVAGTAIDLTALNAAATVSTFTITPIALSASPAGFYWQGSNDNTNFSNLSAVTYSSVTYSAAGNSIWDFTNYQYKYLRMVFTGPTRGGIALLLRLFGRD